MLQRLHQWLRCKLGQRPIPNALWQHTLAAYPFLQTASNLPQLRQLCGRFLAEKEFHGTHGLLITDEIALAIAAQACLPVLHLGLHWYKDFVGIVVYPGAMLAQREVRDGAGVVHRYREPLAGQAMHQGPVVLNWQDVSQAGEAAALGTNLVIHEFAHKIDLYGAPLDADADGCPPLPPGFMGAPPTPQGAYTAREQWRNTLHTAYHNFASQVQAAERFGTLVDTPWLDAYGATSPAEFFAVTLEAYFVARTTFALHYPGLLALYDAFFRRSSAAV